MQNFIGHFFGEVVKTEVDGVVVWALPCDLDIGLLDNPRVDGEGLACYFLRLFRDGITGLAGAQGDAGANGADGHNAYSVTLAGFTQPTIGSPVWSVKLAANPAIRVGETVFVDGSGYSTITAIGGDWLVVFSLVKPLVGVTGHIDAGKLVVVAGPQGLAGPTGATGATGPAGPTGSAGASFTATNGGVVCAGSPRLLDVVYGQVVFGGTEPQLTLPVTGTYLVQGIVGIEMAADAPTLPPDQTQVKLWDATAAAYVSGSEQIVQCFEPSEKGQIHISVLVVIGSNNHTIQLYGKTNTLSKAIVIPERTSLTYVRLA